MRDRGIAVTVGEVKSTTTCVDDDLVPACGAPGAKETIFEFVAPATSGYSFRAFDHGTQTISNSVAQLNGDCSATTGTCSGILGISLDEGDIAYLVVQSGSGGCAEIDFEVM